jgi:hypothetical protein
LVFERARFGAWDWYVLGWLRHRLAAFRASWDAAATGH